MRRTLAVVTSLVLGLGAGGAWAMGSHGGFGPPATGPGAAGLGQEAALGKLLFFDENLSRNRNQSCAACHDPDVGWTGPDGIINATGAVYEGSVPGRFGNRKPPSAAYGIGSPPLFVDEGGVYTGGMFWDGRATGWRLGDPLAEQAQGPFLNPVEQGLSSPQEVLDRICESGYSRRFKQVYGTDVCADGVDVPVAYDLVGLAIAAYERSRQVNPFTSKYDFYLDSCVDAGNDWDACAQGAGERGTLDPSGIFSDDEWAGLQVFVGAGKCSLCHVLDRGQDAVTGETLDYPLFTDYTYDNLGTPRNELNPYYHMGWFTIDGESFNPFGRSWIDPGLAGFICGQSCVDQCTASGYEGCDAVCQSCIPTESTEYGKHKVPTLRNVDERLRLDYEQGEFVKAYTHNGYFKSLEEVVDFYNTRDVKSTCTSDQIGGPDEKVSCWPAPEVAATINQDELGNLGLDDGQEAQLVAFMEALTDGYNSNGRGRTR